MAYRYVFNAVAAKEYEDAFIWYEKQSVIAADNLILAFQSTIATICAHPLRYRNTYKNLRELALKKYPYSIIYFVDEENETIVVTSFFHHKRHPAKKYKKSQQFP